MLKQNSDTHIHLLNGIFVSDFIAIKNMYEIEHLS